MSSGYDGLPEIWPLGEEFGTLQPQIWILYNIVVPRVAKQFCCTCVSCIRSQLFHTQPRIKETNQTMPVTSQDNFRNLDNKSQNIQEDPYSQRHQVLKVYNLHVLSMKSARPPPPPKITCGYISDTASQYQHALYVYIRYLHTHSFSSGLLPTGGG